MKSKTDDIKSVDKKYKVCVMLSTYNGEKFLQEQMDSILKQKGVKLKILIRDDGSLDTTRKLLQDYSNQYPEAVKWINPNEHTNLGFSGSFFTLLKYALEYLGDWAEYYAFSDQDDVWLEQKLFVACKQLEKYKEEPALYFCMKKIVDENLQELGKDIDFYFDDFTNIVQWTCTNASGCSQVMNRKLAELFEIQKLEETNYIHDSFIYRLAVCANFKIICDRDKYIMYRQHGENTIGAIHRKSIIEKFQSAMKLFKKREHYVQGIVAYIWYHFKSYSAYNQEKIDVLLNYNKSLIKKIKLMNYLVKNGQPWSSQKALAILKVVFNLI